MDWQTFVSKNLLKNPFNQTNKMSIIKLVKTRASVLTIMYYFLYAHRPYVSYEI